MTTIQQSFITRILSFLLLGYFHGDPCEFGLIAFDCPNKLHRCATKYGKEIAAEMQTGMGLITLFAWTVAQAYYLGMYKYLFGLAWHKAIIWC